MRPAAATVSPDSDFWLQSRVLRKIYTSVRKILLRVQPARCDRIVIGKDTRLFVRHKLIASEFGHLPVILNTARQLLHHPRHASSSHVLVSFTSHVLLPVCLL